MPSENTNKAEAALQNLKRFNRKERYHLLRQAVVGGPFLLQGEFREQLVEALPVDSIPDDAYVAMDYHLDWIASALCLADERVTDDTASSSLPNWLPHANGEGGDWRVMTGTQEDVDLLVAWRSGEDLHLALVEAKVESGWDGSQLKSKGDRLGKIFADGSPWRSEGYVKPYFVLAGPMPKDSVPNFGAKTLRGCPGWFYGPTFTDADRDQVDLSTLRNRLAYVQLTPSHDLYQPRRARKDAPESPADWFIIRTQSSGE